MRFESPRDIVDDLIFAGAIDAKEHAFAKALSALRTRGEHVAFHRLATALAEDGYLPEGLDAAFQRIALVPGIRVRAAFDANGVHVAVSTAVAAAALSAASSSTRASVTGLSILSDDALELLEPRRFPALTDAQVALDEPFGPELAKQLCKFALEHLHLSHCGIGSKGLSALTELPLVTLRVFFDQFPDSAATPLGQMKSLRELSLDACGVRKAVVAAVARLGELRSLGLAKNDDLADARMLAPLAGLSALRALDLEESPVGDDGLAVVGKLHSLERLSLPRANVTGKGLKHLSALSGLHALQLHGNDKMGAAGVKALSPLAQLRVLDVSSCALGPAALEHLGALEALRVLDVSTNDAKVATIEALGHLQLHTLIAENWNLGDKAAAAASALVSVERLDLSDQGIGPKGAVAISKLPKLRALALMNNEIGISGATSMGALHALEQLILSTPIGDKGAEALGKLEKLRKFEVLDGEIGAKGAAALARLTELRTLDLAGSHIGDGGATALSHLTALRSLRVPANDIGPKGAKALAQLTGLRELNLSGNALGAGLSELEKLQSLERLEVAGVRADKATRARLAKTLSGCVVDFED